MVNENIPQAPSAKAEVKEEKLKFSIDLQQKITPLPEIKEKTSVDLRYPLILPYAYVHIYWDDIQGELIYNVEEPNLDDKEKEILELIKNGIEELINLSFISVKEKESLIEYLQKNVDILLKEFGIKLEKNSYLKIMYYIYRDFIGLNKIEPLMNDYYIEDIECNGVKSPLYIVHRRFGNIKTNIIYEEYDELNNFVEKLAQKSGKYISYATPLLDASLPDGSRCNATFTEDITSKGPTFCFTDGYFQLSNGEIVKIEELFERCKNNFGFKIERGNEIIEVNNIGCCGVNEGNLDQINSRLKTIIKLQPPDKLVRVNLNDGSEITTTLNHLFHVVDSNLNLVEAGNLKEGMFVPVPSKIDVEGCIQTINVANLIKDFSYIHKVCMVSNTPIKELVNNTILVYKNNFKNYRKQLSQEYGVHNSYFYEILNKGTSISFEILDKMCENINNLGDLSIVVYGGGTKGKSKSIMIPKEVDEDLAYLAGAIISDGHLSKANIDISCYEEGFRDAVVSKLIKGFGKADTFYDGKRVYLCNLFVPYFFNKVFDIPYGKKCNTVKVPKIIFKSTNKIIASFIKGLFDGDGTCKSGLSYKTNSKQLAEELTYLLSRFGIYSKIISKNNQYRVIIPSIYESVYKDKIGFNNKFKLLCLNELINKKYNDAKSYINNGRIPSKPILNIIKEIGISKNKLSKILAINYNRFYYDSFSKPFVKKLIPLFESEINKKNIKNNNLDYIKWLVNCNQEFVKIKSVDIFDNLDKKPVYDIELEPCKFFIAGNKPMNIFDTIRKFTREPWSPIRLLQMGTVSAEMLAYLWLLVENGCNVLVVGGTGSGKTTFLNTIAFFIPPQARIVSIEDTRELSLMHENWLPSVARAGLGVVGTGGEKTGEITLFDLLKESFRQRPDYVIVGEIRGKEAYVLFQGMASIKGDEEILVLNDNHPKKIKIKNLQENIKYKVICMDEVGKMKIIPIQAKYIHPKRKELYKIITKKGREIILTPNHSIFSYNKNNKIETKYSENLKENDSIIIPARIPCGYADIDSINFLGVSGLRIYAPKYIKKAVKKLGYEQASKICDVRSISDFYSNFKRSGCSSLPIPKFKLLMQKGDIKYNLNKIKIKGDNNSHIIDSNLKISNELLRLLGYYISEGSLQNGLKKSKLALYAKRSKILEDMKHCIKSVVGNINIRERVVRGYGESKEISFSHKPLLNFIEQYCGKGSLNKRAPSFIFGLSKEKIGQFLSGLYSGDGCFTKNYYGYYTISEKLASDVVQLLNVYGIVSTIRKRTKRKNIDYEILFYLYEDKEEFLKYVNPLREKIPLRKGKKRNLVNDVYIDKIKKIEKINLKEPEAVYDISVPGYQNFIGGFGGVMLHNSGHPSLGTMHADDVATVIRRLQTPPINLSPSLVETLDVACLMTFAKVKDRETRKLRAIQEIISVDEHGKAKINTPFSWDPRTNKFLFKKDSNVLNEIVVKKGISREKLDEEFSLRSKLFLKLYQENIFDFNEVQKIIHSYYKTPERVLKRFNLR